MESTSFEFWFIIKLCMTEDLALTEHISHFFCLFPQLYRDFLFLSFSFLSGTEFCPIGPAAFMSLEPIPFLNVIKKKGAAFLGWHFQVKAKIFGEDLSHYQFFYHISHNHSVGIELMGREKPVTKRLSCGTAHVVVSCNWKFYSKYFFIPTQS